MDKNLILTPISWVTIKETIHEIVTSALREQHKQDLQERLLSPAETCSLFQPKISKTTLASWTKQGLLAEHRYGGRVYYKYSEVIKARKTIRRYGRG